MAAAAVVSVAYLETRGQWNVARLLLLSRLSRLCACLIADVFYFLCQRCDTREPVPAQKTLDSIIGGLPISLPSRLLLLVNWASCEGGEFLVPSMLVSGGAVFFSSV